MKVDGRSVEFHQTRYAISRERAAIAGFRAAEDTKDERGIRIKNTHLFNMAHHYAEYLAALDVFDNDYDMGFSETLQDLADGNAVEQWNALVKVCALCGTMRDDPSIDTVE